MKKHLAISGPIPAAQYIRMSTEHQRFSPDAQKLALETYALRQGYQVIATYQDSGKSGLTLKGRPALKKLLSDVLSGDIKFRAILVLDVSRWGRFQDADQAAHYEYMCREAGVPVQYCSETFDNDGGAMASIAKHMKRVMAAEYSRDLSVRVSRAQRHQAALGFRQGGVPVFGVRRRVVDDTGKARMLLSPGEHKALSTDKVVFVRGTRSEVALIQRIFRMYVRDEMSITQIVSWLEANGKMHLNGRLWTYASVRLLLKNEIYIGTYVFGRRYNNLGNHTERPAQEWIRAEVLKPIIANDIFLASLIRLKTTTRLQYTDKEIGAGLRQLFAENGIITFEFIKNCNYLPHPTTLWQRFGGLQEACQRYGLKKPRRCLGSKIGRTFSDERLLAVLTSLFRQHSYVSGRLIDGTPNCPKSSYFASRFGGLLQAYRMAGLPLTVDECRQHAEVAGLSFGRYWPPKPCKIAGNRKSDGSRMTEIDLLDGLKLLLHEHHFLSGPLIDADPRMPSSSHVRERFGGLPRAYELAGFCSTRKEIQQAAFKRRSSCSP